MYCSKLIFLSLSVCVWERLTCAPEVLWSFAANTSTQRKSSARSGRKINQSRPKGICTPAQRQQLKTLYWILNQTLADPVYTHKLTVQLYFPVVPQQGHVYSCFSSFWRFSWLNQLIIQSVICERSVKNTHHNLNWKLEMFVWKITETIKRLSK